MSEMSKSAPTDVKAGACVLPISTTSGLSELDMLVVSLSTSPSQLCSSMTSFEPGFSLSKVSVR